MTIAHPSAAETLEFDGVVVERFPLGKHAANAYIVYHLHDRHAALIDPGAEPETLMRRISELNLKVDSIMLTHAHWDHVGGAGTLSSNLDAPVYMHRDDQQLLKAAPIYAFRIDELRFTIPSNIVIIDDTTPIALGQSDAFSIRHVPGHTQGGVAYRVGRALFTGDTLMKEGAGRVDLPGGNEEKLKASLTALQRDLKANDVICPGHGHLWPAAEAAAWLVKHLRSRQ